MPQLDYITFFNQIFCLVIFFSLFYLVISQSFVPFLSRVLKLRNKKFFYNGSNKSIHDRSSLKVQEAFAVLLSNSCKSLSFFISGSVAKRLVWLNASISGLEKGTIEVSLFKAVAGLQNQTVAQRVF